MASYTYQIKISGPNKWVIVYEYDQLIYKGNTSFSATEDVLISEAITALQDTFPEVVNMKPNVAEVSRLQEKDNYDAQTPTTSPSATNIPTSSASSTPSMTAKLSPDMTSLSGGTIKIKEDIRKLTGIGKPPTFSSFLKMVWDTSIKPKLLTERQVMKKMIMMQGQSYPIPITEERAQLMVYGKVYDRKPELPTDTILTLWDNDKSDPNCVSKPSDDDYIPPMDENSPMWQDILKKKDELKDSLDEIGIKMGEIVFSLPIAAIEITASLISIASSAVILPPGSGLPTALSSLQTMINSIAKFQAAQGLILPSLQPLLFLALLLPASAKDSVEMVTIMITAYVGLVTSVTVVANAVMSLISGLSSMLPGIGTADFKMPTQEVTIKPEATPSSISKGTNVTLKSGANGGSWKYNYEWTEYAGPEDVSGTVIPADKTPDDGTRNIKPGLTGLNNSNYGLPTTYTYSVKVTEIIKDLTTGKDVPGVLKIADVIVNVS